MKIKNKVGQQMLNKQIYLYSIDTSCFYEPQEDFIHKKMLRLYKLRSLDPPEWKKRSINRILKKEKNKLSALLDERKLQKKPRILKPDSLLDKNIITLFESSLTRLLKINTNDLTKELMVLTVFFFQVFEDLVKYGFYYQGEKYIFLTASAGQIRTKKAVFIKESAFNKIQPTLMCGLTIDKINEQGGINPN